MDDEAAGCGADTAAEVASMGRGGSALCTMGAVDVAWGLEESVAPGSEGDEKIPYAAIKPKALNRISPATETFPDIPRKIENALLARRGRVGTMRLIFRFTGVIFYSSLKESP